MNQEPSWEERPRANRYNSTAARDLVTIAFAVILAITMSMRLDAFGHLHTWLDHRVPEATEALLASLVVFGLAWSAFAWRRWREARRALRDRVAAEEALRASERDYRELLERAADAIFIFDQNGWFIKVNAQATLLTGYTRSELLARRIADIMPPEEASEVAGRIATLGDSPRRRERLIRCKDGAIIPVDVSATRLSDERVQVIIRDISARKATEAALRAEEARSRVLLTEAERRAQELALLDRIRTALARDLDLDATLYALLPAVAEAFGDALVGVALVEGDQMVGRAAVGLSDRPLTLPIDRGIMGRCARTGRPILAPDVRADPDFFGDPQQGGSEVCVPLLVGGTVAGILNVERPADPPLDADDLRRLVAIGEQVALAIGRARLHGALAASEARFRALVQRATDAVAIFDSDGTIRYQSPAAGRILGLTPDELIGTNAFALAHPDDLSAVQASVVSVLDAPGASVTFELRAFRADGQWRWIEATATNLLDDPAIAALVANYRDITERKEAEAALRASEDLLAVAQRIAHLGSWEQDEAAGELRWSDEVYRIFGHAPRSFDPTIERYEAQIHPDDRAHRQAARGAARAEDRPYALDCRIVRPDGEVRVVHQQVEIIRDTGSKVIKRVGVVQDVTERRALEARLEHQATHDSLTGLPNRMLLLDRLGRALARSRRGEPAGAVLFLDLDNFKVVNDTMGHDAGDRLLVAVTARLRARLRDADTLARLGGDEFAVLLEDVDDPREAAEAAERLASALDTPVSLDGQEHRVTASVGIVLASGGYARAEEVLRDADVAMYRAKTAARGGYALFDPAMQAQLAARVTLERDLRRALERGEFVLYYQPITDLRTGRPTGVEALVRWQHPGRGLVPPGEFIPLAEETGLITPLGRWVLREACRQAREWADAGTPLPVAINLTAQEFQRPALVAEVAAALAAARLEPRMLCVEITEGLAMRDAATSAATLAALRELGVRVAIDDFGTGYSSLAYLKRLPVDTLKVDRAFVDGLGTDPEDTAIVEAVISLARTLGLAVVAEGVETAEQALVLARLGCDLAQGYYFARPQPAAELTTLLFAAALVPPIAHGTHRDLDPHELARRRAARPGHSRPTAVQETSQV